MNRILVIRGGAIGDFVLTLPAIKLLRNAYPAARLEILGYTHIVALAEQRFYADATRSIEYAALAGFFARGADLSAELAKYFGSFDLVVSYLFDPDGIFAQNLDRAGVDNLIVCPSKIVAGEHAALQLARPLEQLGLSLTEQGAVLYPSVDDRELAQDFSPPGLVVAIHPGSGSETKNWPIENWQALGEWLLESGHAKSLLIAGGEADRVQLQFLRSAWTRREVHFADNLPLPHLAAVLEKCALFLGHDSGISHIAAAVGIPCVLLFGPTDPKVWAPGNTDVRVLQAPTCNISALSLETVQTLCDYSDS